MEILSDEKLKKFISEEQIIEIAKQFSNGQFNEIITKFFTIIEPASGQNTQGGKGPVATPSGQTPNILTPNLMFGGLPNVTTPAPQPKIIFNGDLLEKFNEDQMTQQILLTVVLYCLFKLNKIDDIKGLMAKYNYPSEKIIFPLILLKSKYYIKTKSAQKAMDLYSEAIKKYEDYKSKDDKTDKKNIITIETFSHKFIYFDNLFNYLFALNNIDSKIKKLYFEYKMCLYSFKFHSQAYKLILDLYQKYPNDLVIQFEVARDSIMFSKFDKFQEMLELIKKEKNEQTDENKKKIYDNYILYTEALYQLSFGKIDETKSKLEEILKNDDNALIKNNSAILDIYKNNPKECYNKLLPIISPNQMDSSNESIRNTINILSEKFNVSSK